MSIESQDPIEESPLLRLNTDNISLRNFKPEREVKLIKTRGAILVLVWNYFTLSVYYFITFSNSKMSNKIESDIEKYYFGSVIFIMWIFYPLAGWLADVHFGRYKTVCCSIWITWIGMLLITTGIIITKFHENTEPIIVWVQVVVYLVIVVGLSTYQANIIQFGVDQLIDASSEEIKAFLTWYIWTFVSSGCIYELLLQCIPNSYNRLLKAIYTATCLTCVIVSDILFNKYFVKEPVTANPIKLVIKVLKYALKTKQPQRRSAFTYWEDKPPSRIDFGKSKYGGPFTNEQVEDVKTFLRMFLAMASVCSTAGIMLYTLDVQKKMLYHFKGGQLLLESYYKQCFTTQSVNYLNSYTLAVLIPLYQLVLNPIFHSCIPNMKSMTKILIGMLLILVAVLCNMSLEIVGHIITDTSNVTCLLHDSIPLVPNPTMNTLDVSYQWLILPQILLGVGVYSTTLGSIEFVCAQSPYSMKGIMFGFLYFLNGVSMIITVGILYPFTRDDMQWTWLGCGLWYFLLVMVITVVAIVLFTCTMRWYKTRERGDNLPNIEKFAVDYYEKMQRSVR